MLFSKKQGNKAFCLFGGCGGSKRLSNKDYECLPYTETAGPSQQPKQQPKQQPLCEPTPIKIQSTENKASLSHLNKLIQHTTRGQAIHAKPAFAPAIESTRVEETLIRYPAINPKPSSTFVHRTHRKSDETDEPCLSKISEQSSCFSSPRNGSGPFQPLYQSATISDEAIYVCVRPYEPKHQGDIALKYSERVQVLHATDGYAFVKLIGARQECGYVSSSSLLLMSQFMSRI